MTATLATLVAAALATSNSVTGQVWFVDDSADGLGTGTTWADAFPHLQDALDAAGEGDQVWVAEGRYRPDLGSGRDPLDRTEQFELLPGVELYGGFLGVEASVADRAGRPERTILTGDLLDDDGPDFSNRSDNSERILEARGPGVPVSIDGVTIRAGESPGRPGGGVRLDRLDARLRDVSIVSCSANVGGGLHAHMAELELTRCSFTGCRATVFGGAVFLDRFACARILDSRFLSNRAASNGGAIAAFHASDPACVLDCRRAQFMGNHAVGLGGAIFAENFALTLENSVLSGNSADVGGAVFKRSDDDATFHLLTVSNNTARFVAGVWAGRGTNAFRNSVLWGNRAGNALDDQQLRASGTVSVDHCCVEGWTDRYPGSGNLSADPRFVDSDGADDVAGTLDDLVKLAADSPCIDAGWNRDLPADDLFRLPRAVDDPGTLDSGQGQAPLVDLGAYEFQGPLVRYPRDAIAGDTITSDGFRGLPGGLLLLAVVSIDGAPYFLPLHLSSFDLDGRYHREVTTPPGLPLVELELQLFGQAPSGGVFSSNREPIRFL